MVASAIFDEIVDFIAAQNPERVLAFKASEKASQRYEFLVQKEKTEGLDAAEKEALENFEILERIMRRAKAKARLLLAA